MLTLALLALHPPNSDLIGFIVDMNTLKDDRAFGLQSALQPAHEHHPQLGIDHIERIESVSAIPQFQEARRPGKGVYELAAVVDQQARWHELIEQRIVGSE